MRFFGMLAAAAMMVLVTARVEAQDEAAGARDYPGLGRFAGSVATAYEVKAFDSLKVQAKAFRGDKPVDQRALEGKTTRIAYRAPEGASLLEVFRNFTIKANAAGFATLLDCETDQCGGMPFAGAVEVFPLPAMWLDGFGYRYFSGRKPAGASSPETYVSIVASTNNGFVYVQVSAVEIGAMADKMVDASKMAKGLAENGHIALYGIYFDTAKADVKPESAPTLAEIAKLLKANPSLKTVYVVGHTDSQGAFDYNMALSRQRADAIVAALVSKHGVAAARLKSAGVGFLAPVGSNATEAGQALNRRTELVLP